MTHTLQQRFSACERYWDLAVIGDRQLCFYHAGDAPWHDGVNLCQMSDAVLPLPLNAQEDTDYYNFLNKINLLSSWLDGTDEAEEGIWVDGAGNNITFFNWRGDQPDNKDEREHYLHYRPGWGGLWNDHDGGNVDHIVCQKEPTGETLFIYCEINLKNI